MPEGVPRVLKDFVYGISKVVAPEWPRSKVIEGLVPLFREGQAKRRGYGAGGLAGPSKKHKRDEPAPKRGDTSREQSAPTYHAGRTASDDVARRVSLSASTGVGKKTMKKRSMEVSEDYAGPLQTHSCVEFSSPQRCVPGCNVSGKIRRPAKVEPPESSNLSNSVGGYLNPSARLAPRGVCETGVLRKPYLSSTGSMERRLSCPSEDANANPPRRTTAVEGCRVGQVEVPHKSEGGEEIIVISSDSEAGV